MTISPKFANAALGIGLTAVSLATIINTTRLHQLSMRCTAIESRNRPTEIIGTRDGQGMCIYDGLREKVAPGSLGRELTPEEEAAFIEALEKIGADTAFVKGERKK